MVIVFLVVYTDEKADECVSRLRFISAGLFPDEEVMYIIADTSKQGEPYTEGSVVKIFPGNSEREFGGWEACLSYVTSNFELALEDTVIVANDTFYSNYGDEYLNDFSAQSYETLKCGKAIYGYMDVFPQPVTIDSKKFDAWVRTSFFITNVRTLMSTQLFKLPYKKSHFFSSDNMFFLPNNLLSDNYRRYLKCWLFEDVEGDAEFNEKWHSAKALTNDNREFFQDKAMCILTEHYLSWGAKEKGVQIIRVNE